LKNPKHEGYFRRQLRENSKIVVFTYFILRALVILALISSLIQGEYERSFTCVLVLILYFLPDIFERQFKIKLPDTLEIIILCFIFAAEILGELGNYYGQYKYWDTMLHTVSGFLMAAVGYAMVDLLNRREDIAFNLSPVFTAMVAFCFSMTLGVLWEFFEFTVDHLFAADMQKDTIIHSFYSVTLDPMLSNRAILVDNINDVAINGESLGLGGYLDIGLIDTMKDLFVNCIGALVFSVFGYFNTKSHGKSKLVKSIVPRRNNSQYAKK